LVPEIKAGYESKGLGIGSESEVRSWENSFQYMYKVLQGSDVPDGAGVAIEFKIPLTSRRIDFLISGYDTQGNSNVAIVGSVVSQTAVDLGYFGQYIPYFTT